MSDIVWGLICCQIVMGASDTMFHHELMERLAWRRSQAEELWLHGVRNLVYSAVFFALGFTELRGAFAVMALIALYGELIITLKDFVEEDRTRKLPPSERVLHTLLALNYGAILMGVTPLFAVYAAQPTGVAIVIHGYWTLPCLAASLGTLAFGVRDLGASRRLRRTSTRPASRQLPLAPRRHVLVTGGTGFIGSRLVEALVARGDEVSVLTRNAASAAHLAMPIRVVTSLEQIRSDTRVDAIVNLAGQATAGGLWTRRYKQKLLASRLEMTRDLVRFMQRLAAPPAVFVSGSAIGVYGVAPEGVLDETSAIPQDGSFSQGLCRDWESAAVEAEALGIRTVLLRTGMVLDPDGGPLGQMLPAFDLGFGGPFGSGRTWMSWISRDDLVRLIDHAIRCENVRGPLNGVAPVPVTNQRFAAALGRSLRRPAVVPLPAWVLRGALGDLAREIFLGSQRIAPARAQTSGFQFNDPHLEVCLLGFFAASRRRTASPDRLLSDTGLSKNPNVTAV